MPLPTIDSARSNFIIACDKYAKDGPDMWRFVVLTAADLGMIDPTFKPRFEAAVGTGFGERVRRRLAQLATDVANEMGN